MFLVHERDTSQKGHFVFCGGGQSQESRAKEQEGIVVVFASRHAAPGLVSTMCSRGDRIAYTSL